MEVKHELPLLVSVDLRVIVMKGYPVFPRSLGLESHHQMQFSAKPRSSLYEVVLIPRQSQLILLSLILLTVH